MTLPRSDRLSVVSKAAIALRIWATFVVVHIGLRRRPLPDLVHRLGHPRRTRCSRVSPHSLGRIVFRLLRVGPRHARCLVSALVLFRLLRIEGHPAELVIGLPDSPVDKDAHAWVEIGSTDVGPPPGRRGHEELVRYG